MGLFAAECQGLDDDGATWITPREPDVPRRTADQDRHVAAGGHPALAAGIPVGQRPWVELDRDPLALPGPERHSGIPGELLDRGRHAVGSRPTYTWATSVPVRAPVLVTVNCTRGVFPSDLVFRWL